MSVSAHLSCAACGSWLDSPPSAAVFRQRGERPAREEGCSDGPFGSWWWFSVMLRRLSAARSLGPRRRAVCALPYVGAQRGLGHSERLCCPGAVPDTAYRPLGRYRSPRYTGLLSQFAGHGQVSVSVNRPHYWCPPTSSSPQGSCQAHTGRWEFSGLPGVAESRTGPHYFPACTAPLDLLLDLVSL